MSETPVQVPPPAPGGADDKTVAIVAYLSLIGFVVALVLHNQRKSALGAYHLRQALGIVVCSVVMSILGIIPFVGCLVLPVLGIGILVMWIMGIVAAANAEMKPVPLLGERFQEWFSGAFD
ncbi:MAG: hypothetical protein QY325_06975 [Flavobacteriales bacterium]|jgi:uncharacterized membrane protein|nr:MAG: hypothetical protein QY325_06975 [Flavobacteriales bacterium]